MMTVQQSINHYVTIIHVHVLYLHAGTVDTVEAIDIHELQVKQYVHIFSSDYLFI